MEIKQINREACNRISDGVIEALKVLEKNLGIKFETKGGKFSDTNYTMKLSASLIKNGKVLTLEAEAFKMYATRYGFEPTDLGRQFSQRNVMYKITGLNTRNRKYKIVGKRMSDNNLMKFTAEGVLSALKK